MSINVNVHHLIFRIRILGMAVWCSVAVICSFIAVISAKGKLIT